MSALTIVAALWLTPTVLIAAWLVLDAMTHRREEARRRAAQDRTADAEWLAVLAATDEPIFAELWAESLRRDLEEWSS